MSHLVFLKSGKYIYHVPMEKEWATWGKYIDSPNGVNRKLLHQASTFLVKPQKKFGRSDIFEKMTPQNDLKKYLCKEYTKSCGWKTNWSKSNTNFRWGKLDED